MKPNPDVKLTLSPLPPPLPPASFMLPASHRKIFSSPSQPAHLLLASERREFTNTGNRYEWGISGSGSFLQVVAEAVAVPEKRGRGASPQYMYIHRDGCSVYRGGQSLVHRRKKEHTQQRG